MSFPTKDERAKCWKTRDDFWACLDKCAPTYQYTSGKDVPKECAELRKLYEKSCPGQWVKHFDRKRTYEQFKDKIAKGFEPLDENSKAN